MTETLQLVATLCATLFAGAALYINVAEHPARLMLETSAALAQWAPSYKRATLMQAPLAVAAFLSGSGAWVLGSGTLWVVAAALIGAVVPFTFVVIMPTNNKLLATGVNAASHETRTLLEKWGTLHAVRTGLGLVAAGLMFGGLHGV